MMCGSCSNENSFKLMYFRHMDKLRGGRDFTPEEMESCMINKVSIRKSWRFGFPQGTSSPKGA